MCTSPTVPHWAAGPQWRMRHSGHSGWHWQCDSGRRACHCQPERAAVGTRSLRKHPHGSKTTRTADIGCPLALERARVPGRVRTKLRPGAANPGPPVVSTSLSPAGGLPATAAATEVGVHLRLETGDPKTSTLDEAGRNPRPSRSRRNEVGRAKLRLPSASERTPRVRSGQVRYITRPKSEAMRVTRQLRLPPRNRRVCI